MAITNPRNVTTEYTYDALGRLTGMVEPVSPTEAITTSYGYNATGAQTRLTDGRGNIFRTTYNPWGMPQTRTEPGGAAFTTAYDAGLRPARPPGSGRAVDLGEVLGGGRTDAQRRELNRTS